MTYYLTRQSIEGALMSTSPVTPMDLLLMLREFGKGGKGGKADKPDLAAVAGGDGELLDFLQWATVDDQVA